MKSKVPARTGFTLIEVLVVVGIIVLLIALLIPAVGAAKASARRTATVSQMESIKQACESYYQTFRAYPSPISERDYVNVTPTGVGTPGFSASQGLVVSLTRSFEFPTLPAAAKFPAAVKTLTNTIANSNPTMPITISADPNVAPRDYSENINSPTAPYKNYNAFLNPKPAELMTAACGLSDAADAPVFCDSAYGTETLPILYYRMDVKYDPQIVGMTVTANQYTAGAQASSFYVASNDYITGQTAGTKAFQNASIGNLNSTNTNAATNLQNLVTQSVGGIQTLRGAYVLISAGPDRTFGPDPKGNVDDIIVTGGL